MADKTERHQFTCRRCGETFKVESPPPRSSIHLIAVAVTLGLWLPIWAVWQWGWIYRLSECPECGRKSRRLLIRFVILSVLSVGILSTYYYLMRIAPEQIAARTANPAPLTLWESLILSLNLLTSQYGVYVLVGWFFLFSLILLISPNRFRDSG